MSRQNAPSLSARFFRWHRWLGWAVALQVVAWIAGGVVFAWVPFKPWVKAADQVRHAVQPLPAGWATVVARHLDTHQLPPIVSVGSVVGARGVALRLKHADSESWVALDGGQIEPPDASDIERFARSLYIGDSPKLEVVRLESVPRRALIVKEAGDRRNLWLAAFNDGLHTRLYFDGTSGELVAIRNDAWVLYDFFWRLHLMDYSDGEDFNHPLIKGASIAALGLALTGVVLAILALRRVGRQWVRARR